MTPLPPRRIALVAAATALVWTLCCLGIARRVGLPEPSVHDEFSYLLGADTFAHGRLANPPHPLGRFFESPHILLRPTYASMYPPGQALVLALGEKLFGAPWYGVLIAGAAMMFLITMTLIEWTSLLPGIVVSAMLGLVFLPPMYWVDSYWGGCLAAAGGAAVLLAIGRYRRTRPIGAGIAFAIGGLILFLTRPFEGGVFIISFAVVCCFWIFRERGRTALAGMRLFLLCAASVLIPGMLWAGWYNSAVTGNPAELPELLHFSQYQTAPLFRFQAPRPEPVYAHPRLAAQHGTNGAEIAVWRRVQAAGFYAPFRAVAMSVVKIFGRTLISLLLIPLAWRDPRMRCVAAALGLCWLGLWFSIFHFPHYAAPLVVAVALLVTCAAETSWRIRIGSVPFGAVATCAVLAVACAFPLRATIETVRSGAPHRTFGDVRAEFIRRMSVFEGEQLVIVSYPYPAWRVGDEWVYNSADIDSQRIVFAHDLGTEQNRALLGYYPQRRAWLLTFDDLEVHLTPYPTLQ